MKNIVKALILVMVVVVAVGCGKKQAGESTEGAEQGLTGEKVKLDFHIMSKCPFGVKVLEAIAPVMDKMGERVELNVHYIGREKDGELTSMHGEQEVQGNILQLCAADQGDSKAWMAFLKCHL